jgi:hypothetical protein
VDGSRGGRVLGQDTGRGLAPEVLARLFEAFFSTKSEGMGIGLNLCRSIVESHQGRMQAENLYNATEVVGCRFTSFWIPVGQYRAIVLLLQQQRHIQGLLHELDSEKRHGLCRR